MSSSWSRKYLHMHRNESFPKAAILIILILMLIRVCDPTITTTIHYDGANNIIVPLLMIILYLSLPVLALYADIKWDRYKAVCLCVIVCFFITLYYIITDALKVGDVIDEAGVMDELGNYLGTVFILCQRCATVLLLSYASDLLVEGSSDQLSSFIWWFYWCLYFGWAITSILFCGFHARAETQGALYITSGHALSLILIGFLLLANRRLLLPEKQQVVVNPLVLIAKVLNFARRNSRPILRSSSTYWNPKKVSRVDFGKHSLGGPFTNEEVESVKVFFRLLPLLICVEFIHLLSPLPIDRLRDEDQSIGPCLISSSYFIYYCVAVFIIPFKQLVLKYFRFISLPLLHKIGCGFFLVIISRIVLIGVGVYVSVSDGNYTCELTGSVPLNETVVGFVSDHALLIVPEVVGGVGTIMIIATSLEFFYAQSPYHMRTLIIGLYIAVGGIFNLISWQVLRFFRLPFMEDVRFGCEFYVFLSGFVTLFFSFCLYLGLAKRYKLRIRDYASSESSWYSYGSNW